MARNGAALAGVGLNLFVAVGVLAADRLFTDIPAYVLVPVLVACITGFILCVLRLYLRLRERETNMMTQESSGDRSPNMNAARDVHIKDSFNVVAPEKSLLAWTERPGGPVFSLSPGIDNSPSGVGRLICGFRISDASPAPGGIEARWVGAGALTDWTAPMRDNTPAGASYLKLSMKPVEMKPTPPGDEVVFEIRFNLQDGRHGGKWTWPLRQHPDKGHWIIDAHLGSGVRQPRPEDTW